jgi:predicted SnoaL-like aldol condensation-catalyzing enzyme
MTTATSAEAMKSRDEPTEANRAIAIELLEAGAAGRAREVMRRYAAPDFIHHNPTFASDAATLAAAMDENAGSNPYTVFEILRTVAEGPLVAVHSRVRAKPGDTPVATAHILRIEDGMIHELWDIAQDLPADSPNEAGMF